MSTNSYTYDLVCIESGTILSKTFPEAVRRGYSRPGLEPSEQFRSRARPTMDQLGRSETVFTTLFTIIRRQVG